MNNERLLSAREAALELGAVPRTAQLRARLVRPAHTTDGASLSICCCSTITPIVA